MARAVEEGNSIDWLENVREVAELARLHRDCMEESRLLRAGTCAGKQTAMQLGGQTTTPVAFETGVLMDTMSAQTWTLVAIFAVMVLLALGAWLFLRQRQSYRLQQRFGAEYGHAVGELGSQAKAESELKARESRVERLKIVALSSAEATRFSQAWSALQGRFVDNPKGVVAQADQLVREVMLARGYPVGDFERRAADISVDHPAVVDHYRAAQAIAVRDQRGETDTEEQRKAVVHYRALFDELLEVKAVVMSPVRPTNQLKTQS